MMTLAIILSIIGVAILGGWLIIRKQKAVDEYRTKYHQALKSGDKTAALAAGREYYSFMRGGGLSQMDEQSIANDLSTMP